MLIMEVDFPYMVILFPLIVVCLDGPLFKFRHPYLILAYMECRLARQADDSQNAASGTIFHRFM